MVMDEDGRNAGNWHLAQQLAQLVIIQKQQTIQTTYHAIINDNIPTTNHTTRNVLYVLTNHITSYITIIIT